MGGKCNGFAPIISSPNEVSIVHRLPLLPTIGMVAALILSDERRGPWAVWALGPSRRPWPEPAPMGRAGRLAPPRSGPNQAMSTRAAT